MFKIQDTESIICEFYYNSFIECILSGKTLLDYTNSFSPNDYKNNEKTTYQDFKDKYVNSGV